MSGRPGNTPAGNTSATHAPPAAAFLARLGHGFANAALLSQALTHRSAADPKRSMLDSNERLEFLGDRVLALVMAEWLSERFPNEREGSLGKRLSVLVAADVLAKVGDAIGLSAALRIPPAEGRTGLRGRATVLADATEALIGAMFLDGGLDPARRFVRAEWAVFLAADPTPPMSAKSRLQEHTLGRALGLPQYRLVSSTGPSHMPVFTVAVAAGGREAEGTGDSKRAAEQLAAEAWLDGIGAPGPAQTGTQKTAAGKPASPDKKTAAENPPATENPLATENTGTHQPLADKTGSDKAAGRKPATRVKLTLRKGGDEAGGL